jgi:probable HAF family extracellular repeat protein
VGNSLFGFTYHATEWSDGSIINLGGLPGSTQSFAYGINDAGQVVGSSDGIMGYSIFDVATEWSNGSVINLGSLPGSAYSEAHGINNAGQVVGVSQFNAPEPSTWAMMLIGFAGLALAGYRSTRKCAEVGLRA